MYLLFGTQETDKFPKIEQLFPILIILSKVSSQTPLIFVNQSVRELEIPDQTDDLIILDI